MVDLTKAPAYRVNMEKAPTVRYDPDWRAHWAPGNPIGEFVRCGVTANNYRGLKG